MKGLYSLIKSGLFSECFKKFSTASLALILALKSVFQPKAWNKTFRTSCTRDIFKPHICYFRFFLCHPAHPSAIQAFSEKKESATFKHNYFKAKLCIAFGSDDWLFEFITPQRTERLKCTNDQWLSSVQSGVGNPDLEPDRCFLGLPDPDPLVRGPDPDPSSSSVKNKKKLHSSCFVTSLWLFAFEKGYKCSFQK